MSTPSESEPDYGLVIYILVRTDIKMSKGKIGAQCGHAVEYLLADTSEILKNEYKRRGSAKICLAVTGAELETIRASVTLAGIANKTVIDAGRTQIAANTTTCLGVGPVEKSVAAAFVGSAKLL